jgi:hypothetical protein
VKEAPRIFPKPRTALFKGTGEDEPMVHQISPCRCFLHRQITGSIRSRDSSFELVSRIIEHKSLSWFSPLCGGNRPTSNGLIFE